MVQNIGKWYKKNEHYDTNGIELNIQERMFRKIIKKYKKVEITGNTATLRTIKIYGKNKQLGLF